MTRLLLACVFSFIASTGATQVVRIAVTTSFENSGLADVLLPEIERDLDIDVQLLVVGTGQALRLGRAGDVDAILVHSRAAEETFVLEGYGTHRREIMYNDFVVIGPKSDPAAITQAQSVLQAFQQIQSHATPFVSRGDDSGTHKAEVKIWESGALDPEQFGTWYRSVGAGMGAALNSAAAMNAYILADRASWLNFKNQADLEMLYSGDPVLFNQYTFIPVSPKKHPSIKHDKTTLIETWLVGEKSKALINSYQLSGQKLFHYNAQTQ